MTHEEMIKFAYETMIKNNPDEAVKVLIMRNKQLEQLNKRINKAIEYIENNDLYTQDIDYDYDDNMVLSPPTDELERKKLLDILRGEDNESN